MIKIDLITGFLGSGKTTFIKKYASYLLKKGMNIGILENDFGAVNVDMMLLQDLMGDNCELEMVSGEDLTVQTAPALDLAKCTVEMLFCAADLFHRGFLAPAQ